MISKSEAKRKGLSKYFTGKICKRGHLSERYTSNSDCVACSIDRAMGVHSGTEISEVYRKQRDRRQKKIEQYRESEREYRKRNADKFREAARNYYWRNQEAQKAKSKKWFSENKEKARECWRRSSKLKRSTIEGRLTAGLRSRISAMASSGARSDKATDYLGCSIEEFRSYLESMFEDGMSWDNYGLHGWHIDHIRPLSSFDLSIDEEIRKAMNYSNMQPLWAEENLKKSNKWQA